MRKFNPTDDVRVEQDADDGDWCVFIKRPNGQNAYIAFEAIRLVAESIADEVRLAMREWSVYERQQIAEELQRIRDNNPILTTIPANPVPDMHEDGN